MKGNGRRKIKKIIRKLPELRKRERDGERSGQSGAETKVYLWFFWELNSIMAEADGYQPHRD